MKRKVTISGEDKRDSLSLFLLPAHFSLGKENALMLGSFFRILNGLEFGGPNHITTGAHGALPSKAS